MSVSLGPRPPPLPPYSVSLGEWFKLAINRAGQVFNGGEEGTDGLAPALLGPQLYAQAFKNEDGVEPLPFNPPEQQAAFNNAVSNAGGTHLYEQHKRKVDLHFKYKSEMRYLASDLAQTLNKEDIRSLEHPQYGMLNVTAHQIYMYMKDKYGTISVQLLRQKENALKTPYKPTDSTTVGAYIADLSYRFRELGGHGQAYSKQVQLSILRDNVTSCGVFDDVLVIYDRAHATADKQDFGELSEILIAEEERKRTTATTGKTGFGNAAIPFPSDPSEADLRRIFTDFMEEYSANAAVPAGGGPAPTPREIALRKDNEDLVLKLARLTNQETKTCRCGTKFTSHRPAHTTCKRCFDEDKAKAKAVGAKAKGRGGEKKS